LRWPHSNQFAGGVDRSPEAYSPRQPMSYCNAQSVRTHDLLEVDAKRFISCHASPPEWVVEGLRATPFVVVRRGVATEQEVPVGVRGVDRNQRWAAMCSLRLVRNILAPPQLLRRSVPKARQDTIPAFRALSTMKKRWMGLDRCWGPGGSVGFELAAGRHVAKPESDLDIVIYAEGRITRDMAKSLDVQTLNVAAAVDVRVETPLCGFSLKEYAWRSQGGILLRTPSGITLGTDPWSDEIPISKTDQVTERG
jgi:phosphoribosyl-dephospho-CoA transferase